MNWRSPFRGIRGKTALIFFGVFLVIVLPVNFFIYKNVKQILIQADTLELQAEGEKLIDKVRLDPPVIPLPPNGYSVFIRVGNQLQTDTLFSSPDFPNAWLEEGTVLLDTLKVITLERAVPYSNSMLLLSIARSTTSLSTQLDRLRNYLFLANAASIVLAGLLVYMVSGWALKPVKSIIQVAARIEATRSMERVPVPATGDEYSTLANSINAMLDRIENSIKTQTNFFASAAHELKTPLAVMQTELSVALIQNNLDTQTKSTLQSQLQEVQRLDRVIQDFLLISQLKSNTLVVRKTLARLDEALYSAIKRCRYLAQEKGTQVKILLQEGLSFQCMIDVDKLEIVLTNLLENAIKYSPDHSIVSVQIDKNDRYEVELTNPSQLPVADVESLKSEFKKENTFSAGLGMGLWISDQIMKLHGSELKLKSGNGLFRALIVI